MAGSIFNLSMLQCRERYKKFLIKREREREREREKEMRVPTLSLTFFPQVLKMQLYKKQ